MTTSFLLATVSTQQKIGVVIAALFIVGWLGYIVTHLKKAGPPPGSEIELAPNRKPYYDDDALETKKLDRSLGTAVILLAVIAIGAPAYWVREGNRQVSAAKGFEHRSVKRGSILFLPTDAPTHGAKFGCGTCHGTAGQGGVATATITDALGRTRSVQWKAPMINNVAERYSKESIRAILVYGRAGTPMPAWGTKGGGPMNDQQIDDLVNYLTTSTKAGGLRVDAATSRKQIDDLEAAEAKRIGSVDAAGNPVLTGEVLFGANCSRCHTRGWSYGEPEVNGGGRYGPSLRSGATVRQFPDEADMVKFVSVGVEYGQPYGVGGIGQNAGGGMPHFGTLLTEEEISQIVAYERSL
jgi:mono/diheme cytochrome c family protein